MTEDLIPYRRGEQDGLQGKPGPAFPTPDSDWAYRLYNLGWIAGAEQRSKLQPVPPNTNQDPTQA